MVPPHLRHPDVLRQLLEYCDRLEACRESSERATRPAGRRRLREQKIRIRDRLRDGVMRHLPELIASPESKPGATIGEDADDWTMVMLLLHRRLTNGQPTLLGRELLWVVEDSTRSVLSGMTRLMPESPLLRSGLVVPATDSETDEEDVLHRPYMLAAEVLQRLSRRACGLPNREGAEALVDPWSDDIDVFQDWQDLSRAYQRRAAKLFPESAWHEEHGDVQEPLAALDRRIERANERLSARRLATPRSERLEFLTFERDFGLGELEMLLVTTLLWEEAVRGGACVPVIDLVRLVSVSPRDVLRRRRLFAPTAPLAAHGIIEFEDMFADKPTTADAYLSGWVSARLLETQAVRERAIAADEKIEFHGYLSRLHGSDEFFKKLD